jgi:alpha-tubulin suppressor-like RCC1 family protein
VRAGGDLVFAQLSAGGSHSCGLTAAGAAYCWGYNPDSRLGDSTTTHQPAPVAVRQPAGVAFVSIHAAGSHSCALTAMGEAWCWGSNHVGQLGIGMPLDRHTPVRVAGGLTFRSFSANGNSCGVTKEGTTYCWGSNQYGSVGTGTVGGMNAVATVPTPVQGGVTFAKVFTGGGHNCGLTADGRAYCWGDNLSGQLGDGQNVFQRRGLPTPVLGGLTFTALALNYATTCGLTSSGTVYCWGSNYRGLLGNGPTLGWSLTPVPVVLP